MAAIKVVALLKAQAGHEDTVGAALRRLGEGSRGEPGCESYEVFKSSVDPATFATVELWASEEALGAHNTGPHPAAALEAAGQFLAAPPEIHPLRPL